MASSYLVHQWVLKKEDQVRRQSLFNLGIYGGDEDFEFDVSPKHLEFLLEPSED